MIITHQNKTARVISIPFTYHVANSDMLCVYQFPRWIVRARRRLHFEQILILIGDDANQLLISVGSNFSLADDSGWIRSSILRRECHISLCAGGYRIICIRTSFFFYYLIDCGSYSQFDSWKGMSHQSLHSRTSSLLYQNLFPSWATRLPDCF